MNISAHAIKEALQALQLERTLQTIEHYKSRRFDDVLKYQELTELVFELLGSDAYQERLFEFEQASTLLLGFLLKPGVASVFAKLPDVEQDAISRLLSGVQDFFRQLNTEYYRLELLLIHLRTLDVECGRLRRLEIEYGARLESYYLERARIEQESKRELSESLRFKAECSS